MPARKEFRTGRIRQALIEEVKGLVGGVWTEMLVKRGAIHLGLEVLEGLTDEGLVEAIEEAGAIEGPRVHQTVRMGPAMSARLERLEDVAGYVAADVLRACIEAGMASIRALGRTRRQRRMALVEVLDEAEALEDL